MESGQNNSAKEKTNKKAMKKATIKKTITHLPQLNTKQGAQMTRMRTLHLENQLERMENGENK